MAKPDGSARARENRPFPALAEDFYAEGALDGGVARRSRRTDLLRSRDRSSCSPGGWKLIPWRANRGQPLGSNRNPDEVGRPTDCFKFDGNAPNRAN